MKSSMNLNPAIAGVFLCLSAATLLGADTNGLAIVPWPQKVTLAAGVFKLTPETGVYADPASRRTADFLTERLRRSTGYPFPPHTRFFSGQAVNGGITLTTRDADTNLGPEGYALAVTPDSVVIRAPTQAGLFYGVQTLFQLLPPEIFSSNAVRDVNWQMPCVQIEDWPRFKWRGLMLDVSRHFFNKSEVETVLDAMAMHKLNVFHWHLTDDQGWRLEIKKYPGLTSVGAWRLGVGFGLASNSASAYGPDGRYGGFYTPDDVREVVAYAAARHITIVPEIEMPGHATAALAAYPQLGCTGGPFTMPMTGGVFNGIYCPANEETFRFLEDVLAEVVQLFPGQYVHVGGDEVPKDTWRNDPGCRALMEREHLKTQEELQSWFIRRIEKMVNQRGRTLVGWSEILQGGLAPNAVVMDWIGGGRLAAGAGHDVVMTPMEFCYFNRYQSANTAAESLAMGGYLPLDKVYAFEPIPAQLAPEFQRHILGAQGNLWTEHIPNLRQAEYMIFPRLSALAEVTWSARDARNRDDFYRRLGSDEKRLDCLGVNYCRTAP